MVLVLCSSGRSWDLGVSLDCMSLRLGSGLWQGHVSAFPAQFDVDNFSVIQCVGVTQPLLDLFQKEWSMCSCIFSVSVAGGKVRGLLCHHLGDVTHVKVYFRCNSSSEFPC